MASSTAGSLLRKQGKKKREAHSFYPFLRKHTELQLDAQRQARPRCRVAERRPLVSCSGLVRSERPHILLHSPLPQLSLRPSPALFLHFFSPLFMFLFVSGVLFNKVAPSTGRAREVAPSSPLILMPATDSVQDSGSVTMSSAGIAGSVMEKVTVGPQWSRDNGRNNWCTGRTWAMLTLGRLSWVFLL